MATRIAVSGAQGRMGRFACSLLANAPDVDYVGGFARRADPENGIFDSIEHLLQERSPAVVIDFTTRPATQRVAKACVEHGVVPVIGSSEWNDEERAELARLCDQHNGGALIVPNFAIGAVLMMRFAEQAARFFPTIEIVETHRHDKRDKPSGTAAATAQRIRENGGPSDVPIHSVRLRGALSHQEVLCGNTGELLTVRHDSFSVDSFAEGILLAARNARTVRRLQIGLDAIIGDM